eukprot:1343639-Pleurochrysis_carterae.AAC.1
MPRIHKSTPHENGILGLKAGLRSRCHLAALDCSKPLLQRPVFCTTVVQSFFQFGDRFSLLVDGASLLVDSVSLLVQLLHQLMLTDPRVHLRREGDVNKQVAALDARAEHRAQVDHA